MFTPVFWIKVHFLGPPIKIHLKHIFSMTTCGIKVTSCDSPHDFLNHHLITSDVLFFIIILFLKYIIFIFNTLDVFH